MDTIEILRTLLEVMLVAGVAGAGILALPWAAREVEASWDAWRALGAALVGLRSPEPSPWATLPASEGELLPEPTWLMPRITPPPRAARVARTITRAV